MQRLHDLVGAEHDLAEVAREIRTSVRGLGASGVGGFLVTCSDESEHECAQAFQRGFALEMLPRLKYGERVPFRIANPGARYEWGAVQIAENHFATAEARRDSLALVVKINGHVAATQTGASGLRFGSMERYGDDSVYCGAVDAVLNGATVPFAADLRADLLSEGTDRLASLQAPELASDGRQALFGALALARIQARKCVLDIQDHVPAAPTVYVVMHGVTLNKPGHDSELVGGLYVLDHRGAARTERYHGLGDDPAAYQLSAEAGRVHVRDPQSGRERPVRDHRALAARRLEALSGAAPSLSGDAHGMLGKLTSAQGGGKRPVNRAALKLALAALAAASPLASALVLVAEGAAEIHHARKLDQAEAPEVQERLARDVVDGVRARIDDLPPELADRLAAALVREFQRTTPSA